MEGLSTTINDFRDIMLRRRWLVLTPIIPCVVISLILCFTLPKIYRAETLILVTSQKIPEEYVQSTVRTDISERLATIRQEIFSRTRLKKIIDEFGLYKEMQARKPMESVLQTMRDNVELEVKGEKSFTVHYYGKDPETVMNVTNKLAGLFIEENLIQRERLAKGTTEFLSTELEKVERKLREQDKRITQFKAQYRGSLPGQIDLNLRVINNLISEKETLNTALSDAKNRKILLQEQISSISSAVEVFQNKPGAQSILSQRDPYYAEFLKARSRLVELESIYTDEHPEIKRLRLKIARLNGPSIDEMQSETDTKAAGTRQPNPLYREILSQINSIDLEIPRLEEQLRYNKVRLQEYQSRLAKTPQLEQELGELTRDYENNKKIYDELLMKKMNAEQAENLERMKKSEQFEILDPAQMPEVPVSPNAKRLLAVGLLVGLAIGIGLAYYREYQKRLFYSTLDVEHSLELPVLASIPKGEPLSSSAMMH